MSTEKAGGIFPLVLHRRDLLKDGAIAGGVAALGMAPFAGATAARTLPADYARMVQFEVVDDLDAYEPRALTPEELLTLKDAIDCLIPSDEIGPGASESGVFVYIDRSLAKPYAEHLPAYQSGLAALDEAAGADGFTGITNEQQVEILQQAEANEVAEEFFELLLAHTQEGMFADPMYGGNRNFAGWDLLNYPGLRLAWSPEDQDFGAEIEPEHLSLADLGGYPQ